ncbi:TraR/DksA family transcriptional regulator [Halomonas campisalis]|uniref:TraR/DksA family transcriptional regulator n=1 Tax=Billgrantia campisalis TaxID=74661 RepID=A0ABS9P6N2_9GAMM|nr:TraR/DksA family transcriptional regulator [Halomonas campisalis]MCG6657432.1 TraR/DksA family transcriptional regulator [Halomonas campisalis]MDR5863223.1 TraR/DksA family transcriptional regulator [Halomonas campisalis]
MTDRKAVLEGLRDELIERIDRYRAHKERRGGALDKDIEEQAVEVQNDDVVDGLEREAEEELAQVMRALARLEAGEGDDCERCGEPIDPRRLQALPYTTVCVDCAEP